MLSRECCVPSGLHACPLTMRLTHLTPPPPPGGRRTVPCLRRAARQQYGLLEKKKDYQLRAKDYHRKEKALQVTFSSLRAGGRPLQAIALFLLQLSVAGVVEESGGSQSG